MKRMISKKMVSIGLVLMMGLVLNISSLYAQDSQQQPQQAMMNCPAMGGGGNCPAAKCPKDKKMCGKPCVMAKNCMKNTQAAKPADAAPNATRQ